MTININAGFDYDEEKCRQLVATVKRFAQLRPADAWASEAGTEAWMKQERIDDRPLTERFPRHSRWRVTNRTGRSWDFEVARTEGGSVFCTQGREWPVDGYEHMKVERLPDETPVIEVGQRWERALGERQVLQVTGFNKHGAVELLDNEGNPYLSAPGCLRSMYRLLPAEGFTYAGTCKPSADSDDTKQVLATFVTPAPLKWYPKDAVLTFGQSNEPPGRGADAIHFAAASFDRLAGVWKQSDSRENGRGPVFGNSPVFHYGIDLDGVISPALAIKVRQNCTHLDALGQRHALTTNDYGTCTCGATRSERQTARRRAFDRDVRTSLVTAVDTLPEGAEVPRDPVAADRYRNEHRATYGGMMTNRATRIGPPMPTAALAIEALWEIVAREVSE
jgi:hypothetical protein